MSKTFFFEEWQPAVTTEVKAFFYRDDEGRLRYAGGPGAGGGGSGSGGTAGSDASNAQQIQKYESLIFNGTDAQFKRQPDGSYRSENGLTVKFNKPKYGSNVYGNIYHTESGSLVKAYGGAPLKNRTVLLDAARRIGGQINFNLPFEAYEVLAQRPEVTKKMRDILFTESRGVYKESRGYLSSMQ